MDSIGARVLGRITQHCPETRHRDIARDVGMTNDAFSRSVNGERRFSSIELARLADRLDADLHWFITGQPDPNRLVVAARHDFDHVTGKRSVPGREGDVHVLNDIALAYRQAYPATEAQTALPGDTAAVRAVLGSDFVRPLARLLEQRLSVDVVRVAELSTAYSFTIGGQRVIAVPATGNWFYENWSMAHELGHLVLRHHDEGVTTQVSDNHETEANTFAANLLLPGDQMRTIDWAAIDDRILARHVWNLGVSIDALARRVQHVCGSVPPRVSYWASRSTQALLRARLDLESGIDEITVRMDEAAQRRFPLHLQEAHLDRVATGALGVGTLAWMLGIDAGQLDVDAPEMPEVNVGELAAALGL